MGRNQLSRRDFLKTSAVTLAAARLNPGRKRQVSRPRVAWVEDQRAAQGWNNTPRVDQAVAHEMMDLAITQLTQNGSVAGAWNQLFQDFSGGYQSGELIAIKINWNNSHDFTLHNPNFEIVNALLRQLITEVGIPQDNIILYDSTRSFQSHFSAGISAFFPDVQMNPSSCKVFDEPILGTRLTHLLADVDYLINMPLLRTHGFARVTLSFKNHLGSVEDPHSLHTTMHSTSPADNPRIVLGSHPYIRDKTLLVVADGIYGLRKLGPSEDPSGEYGIKDPFPNSIFLATDPLAVDSVMVDYLENRAADFTDDPREHLVLAASEGLGVHESALDYNYQLIELAHCVDGVCPELPPPPVAEVGGCHRNTEGEDNSVICLSG
jgi:hypothetical protein